MKHGLIIASTALLLLTACGFEPVYGTHGGTGNAAAQRSVETTLSDVEIGNIPDRSGQYLRNALIDRFYRYERPANPKYILGTSAVSERRTDLDITKTASSTRGQLRLEITMTLKDKSADGILLQRTLRSVTSYNRLDSEFATRVAEDNARQNALDDLANQIEIQLGLYFKRK